MTVELDVTDSTVTVNVVEDTIELHFYDAAIFDATAFEAWLLGLPAYPNEADAVTALGSNKLYWISAGTDTEFPNTLKRTP